MNHTSESSCRLTMRGISYLFGSSSMSTALILQNDQAAIDGIRGENATQLILAPGNGYTGEHASDAGENPFLRSTSQADTLGRRALGEILLVTTSTKSAIPSITRQLISTRYTSSHVAIIRIRWLTMLFSTSIVITLVVT